MTTIEEKFWLRVDRRSGDECWPWTGAEFAGGYGRFQMYSIAIQAHVASWLIHHGLTHGLFVLHRCDNPPCVNPAHLFLGTNADNMADKVAKGRQQRGVDVPSAKLDPDKVRAIRCSPLSSTKLAAQFGVTHTTILLVRRGVTWRAVA